MVAASYLDDLDGAGAQEMVQLLGGQGRLRKGHHEPMLPSRLTCLRQALELAR